MYINKTYVLYMCLLFYVTTEIFASEIGDLIEGPWSYTNLGISPPMKKSSKETIGSSAEIILLEEDEIGDILDRAWMWMPQPQIEFLTDSNTRDKIYASNAVEKIEAEKSVKNIEVKAIPTDEDYVRDLLLRRADEQESNAVEKIEAKEVEDADYGQRDVTQKKTMTLIHYIAFACPVILVGVVALIFMRRKA